MRNSQHDPRKVDDLQLAGREHGTASRIGEGVNDGNGVGPGRIRAQIRREPVIQIDRLGASYFGPVESTWSLVVRATKVLEVAGLRTARSAAGLFGLGSPRLGVNEKVDVIARTESVQVFFPR